MPIYFREMLTVKYHKINMNRQIVWCYLFMLTFMEVVKTKVTEQGNSHGGIQDSLLEGVSVTYQEFATPPDLGSDVPGEGAGGLVFSPPRLQFGARQLGVPHGERVTLTNRGNRTVRLTSISGNTMHFHSSFFEDKVLPPNGNTSFSVVFLGRERGHVEASLFIHTSEGVHKYMMSGTSTPSLYRLQPFVGIRLPQNASFSPLIYIHNPHDYLLQITEVYSSGGGVELELPDGWSEGPRSLWMLPPHSTRPVVAVRYRPQPTQHMAYVRIKVDGIQTVLVVAVEVMLSQETGPYAIPHVMDFGYGGTKDPPKQLFIYMGNTSPRPVRITSVSVRPSTGGTTSSAVRATAAGAWPVTLPPSSLPHTHVATLTMHWQEAMDSDQCCGKIIIRTKQGQHKIVLPYTSRVLSGGLTFNEASTRYLTCEGGLTAVRDVIVKNEFKVPVYLTDIVVGEGIDKYFEIKDFWSQNLNPDESTDVFKIRLKSWTESLKFESKITLNSNLSSLDIPVFIYNGKLDLNLSIKPHASRPTTLDLGLVGASSTISATVSLRNPNPAAVCLRRCGADMPGAAIRLLGCEHHHAEHNLTACTCVPPGWWAVYSVSVVAPARETALRGELWVSTAHERITVPVALTAAHGGRLAQAEPTHMPDCFPGTRCTLPLRIRSTFPVDMTVLSVEGSPPDPSLHHEGGLEPPVLAARALSTAGSLHLLPHRGCQQDCYAGLHLNTTVGQQWLSRMTLPSDTLELDTNLVNSRYSLYLNLTSKTPYSNLSVRVDTTQVRNHMLSMRVSYMWPRLSAPGPTLLEAPLAQVGRATRLLVRLANPSTVRPVLAQLIVDWMVQDGPDPNTPLDSRLAPDDCPAHRPCARVSDRVFHFPRDANPCRACGGCLEGEGCSPGAACNPECGNGADWEGAGPPWLPAHPDSCVFLMQPGTERNVTVEFYANYSARVSSLLYIRNNLTILEVLRLTGQGVIPSLKFGNRKPGSMTPLLFDLTEKHLKDCDKEKAKKSSAPPNLTVKRTFVARNTGEIPITIQKFFINSIECEGYGFKVLNCEPFGLLPNGTYKVDIAFTPDFTLTKVERTLIIETSLNTAVNYSLISSIPATLAGRCATVLRRPPWEPSLRSAALSLLTCIGVCVLIAGFYDSDRILKVATMALSRERAIVHPPFNLNAIATMDVNKKVEAWDCCPPTAEKKQTEPPSFKVSSWNFEDRNSFLIEDSKTNVVQSQKYEELTQSVSKSRKKLGKRNSNPSDGVGADLVGDTEISQQKDRKPSSTKELQTNNHSGWKNVFTRNSLIGIKAAGKQASQGNSSDSSDTVKLVPSTQEVTHEKHNKLLEVPKKLTSLFNGTSDIQTHSNTQTHHVGNNKKHAKTKCLSHVHQSHNSCEEDTSSTTTESSNNDEADKENDNSTSSSIKSVSSNCKKPVPAIVNKKPKIAVQYKDSYEGDGEDEEYDHKSHGIQNTTQNEPNQRWTKNRENVSSSPQVKSAEKSTEGEKQKLVDITKNSVNIVSTHESTPPVKQNKKENHKTNNKKDKQPVMKKRSLDKSFVFGNKTDHSSAGVHTLAGFNMTRSSPSTPPAIPTVWENKASFSDVVARTDNSLFTHGFTGHVKEAETRKSEPKVTSAIQGTLSINQTQSAVPYSILEMKKPDPQIKTTADLGPIGSNYYPKKSPTSWTESVPDKTTRKYNNNTVNIPQPIKKPQPQKLSEEIGMMNNNNNSFFLNSHSYFSGNSLSDLPPVRSPLGISTHVEANPNNNYSSVASSLNKNSNINPIGSSLGIQNKSSKHGLGSKQNEGFTGSLRDINSMESGNYGQMGSSGLSGNLLDIGSNQGLLDLNSASGIEELTGMEAFDSPMPWDGPGEGNIGLMGNGNESMFDMDYGSRNFYQENKPSSAWGGASSLWDQSTMGRSGLTPGSSMTSDGQLMNSGSQLQAGGANGLMSSERSPAEWLWGYTPSSGEQGASSRLGAIGSAPRPPPGLPTPRHHQQQQQYTQQQQQQVVRAFDPFLSLSSIWSPGSSLDRWATNQQNRDANASQDQTPSHPHAGQYH